MSSHPNDEAPFGPDKDHPRRPIDTPIRQQRMKSWQPILDPTYVIAGLVFFGAIFVLVGVIVERQNQALVELYQVYDEFNDTSSICYISEPNANRQCQIEFTVPKRMEPPIFVHYEISNFYQNHRKYVKSRDDTQLRGLGNSTLGQRSCQPLAKLGDISLNPCGLIANTFFNDVISVKSATDANGATVPFMNETGIAWKSDVNIKYAQVLGFVSEECTSCDAADCNCDSDAWSCDTPYEDLTTNTCYKYYYPDEDTTQYLYETYGNIINPIEGVTNQHFIVWMRTAALPNFRKLYGWISEPIEEGTVLTFDISANWEVQSFQGKKALVVSTTGPFGGKNDFLGKMFWIVGASFLAVAALFSLKHIFAPRKLGDRRYLRYVKED